MSTASGIFVVLGRAGRMRTLLPGLRGFCTKSKDSGDESFDTRMLEVLACPLSKKPLRYDAVNNELVCDELSVAYPVINGIPNLNPQDGRMIKKASKTDSSQPIDS